MVGVTMMQKEIISIIASRAMLRRQYSIDALWWHGSKPLSNEQIDALWLLSVIGIGTCDMQVVAGPQSP
jgi:hypothetical protein